LTPTPLTRLLLTGWAGGRPIELRDASLRRNAADFAQLGPGALLRRPPSLESSRSPPGALPEPSIGALLRRVLPLALEARERCLAREDQGHFLDLLDTS